MLNEIRPLSRGFILNISFSQKELYHISAIEDDFENIEAKQMQSLSIREESAVVEWLASGISKPGVPGSIPGRGTTVMVECPWARHIF